MGNAKVSAADPSAASRRRKPGQDASHFKTDKTGKMIINDANDSDEEQQQTQYPKIHDRLAGGAFMANQTAVDGGIRDARGGLKFTKNTKRAREAERENDVMGMDLDEVMGEKKVQKKKKAVTSLGEEFRSKVSVAFANHHLEFGFCRSAPCAPVFMFITLQSRQSRKLGHS